MRTRSLGLVALLGLSFMLVSCGDNGVTEPPVESFSLMVMKTGPGTGTVTSAPAGIDCGTVCSADFQAGTVVTLTAVAPGGSVFLEWGGACTGAAACQVTMSRAQAVMAEFVAGPIILATEPENGDTDVDPWIETVAFHFSEPMAGCGMQSSGWYPYSWGYSADRKTIYLTRESAGTPLYGWRVWVRPLLEHCRAVSGAHLKAERPVTFTTRYRIPPIRVEGDAAKGFHWPYYLVLPSEMTSPNTLLVEPNNTGTWSDDIQVHDDAARTIMGHRIPFAEDLGSPLLIPVFPRPINPQAPEPGGIYTHSLDRYSLTNNHTGLQRIDLQMVAMIDDALDRLEAMGHTMDRRVFMMGFSASGSFTSRFALIHPDRVKAAAPGSPGGGWPMAPVATWEGVPLRYPKGIMDFEELVGKPFDLETFRGVALYIYVGDADTNPGIDLRGIPADEQAQLTALLSLDDPVRANRWPLAQAVYGSVGSPAQFVIYPGVAHTITAGMFEDVKAFFRANR
jgi:hypothetical protein